MVAPGKTDNRSRALAHVLLFPSLPPRSQLFHRSYSNKHYTYILQRTEVHFSVHFSQQDLDKLNARGLSDDSCIKVQDTYFKPTARRKTGDSVRARVRAQRLGAGERVRGGA